MSKQSEYERDFFIKGFTGLGLVFAAVGIVRLCDYLFGWSH